MGQNITITGTVTDAETGDPIPYANIFIVGKFTGTSSGADGTYSLSVSKRADTLAASTIGYKTVKQVIAGNGDQVIDFALPLDAQSLVEVVVEAGENPANVLLKKIIQNKDHLDPERWQSVSYEAYTKYEIDLVDFTKESIDENKLLSRFPHLKDYVDTMSEDGTIVLPAFFVENLADIYRQQNPEKEQEIVKAVKMSGVEKQDFITNLTGNVNQHFNIYENLVTVMGKNMVSPIADYGPSVYKYTLHFYDTLYIDGAPHLEMTFKPKRKGENTFVGKMLVNIESYAVKSIEMKLSDDVPIEFIEGLEFFQDFEPHLVVDTASGTVDTFFVSNRERLKLKFTYYMGGETRILGKKSQSNKNYTINQPIADTVYNPFDRIVINDNAYSKPDSFWNEVRHDTLMDSEAGIYEMVDSLKRTKRFKTIYYSLQTITSGYARWGKIGFGPIVNAFSLNRMEKFRLRLGVRTNPKFSERVRLEAYGAYGFGDKRFKYGGGVEFIISKRPWHKLSIFGRSDIDLQSRHAEEMNYDNVFSLLSKPRIQQRLYNMEEVKMQYDTELHNDLQLYVTGSYRRMTPYFDFSYMDVGNNLRHDVVTSEVGIRLRWQYKSAPLPGIFDREAKANLLFDQFRKKNSWPVISFVYMTGIPNFIGSEFRYHDIGLNMQGTFQFTAKMGIYYNFWVGQIFGELPYLLLKNPEGNLTYVHNKYFFNNMTLLEFTADRYTSLNFQWYWGGTIIDHIPLLKKLGWRGVASTNVFYGSLNEGNRDFNRLNEVDVAYPTPYIEVGYGIENIFKFIRIDYIQRLTHLNKDREIVKWAIYASLFIKI